MELVKHAKVFKNGRHRAVRIPVEFDFPGDEVTITKEGNRLIIEPTEAKSDLFEWLKTIEPWEEEFPDVDEGLLPLEDVEL